MCVYFLRKKIIPMYDLIFRLHHVKNPGEIRVYGLLVLRKHFDKGIGESDQ